MTKKKTSKKKENKINLCSIGNSREFNYYLFDKIKEVHKKFIYRIKECFGLNWNLKKTKYDKEENPIDIDIPKNKDIHEIIDKTKPGLSLRADVFYGDKRVFLGVHCSQKKRKEFNDNLKKISKIPKPNSNAK